MVMFLITLAAFLHLVWVTKGNILGVSDVQTDDELKKVCKFKVTIELGVYAHEDIHRISKWLKGNSKKRYWARDFQRKMGNGNNLQCILKTSKKLCGLSWNGLPA